MASRSKTITQAQWEHHKPTILGHYLGGLPLKGSEGARNLIQVMKDEHHFSASPAQYEAQFKKWDSPKNLKKHEWKLVLAKIDELRAHGIEARPRVSGQVMDADRINRARRYTAVKHNGSGKAPDTQPPDGSKGSQDIFSKGYAHVIIEVCGSDGHWSRYDGESSVDSSVSALPIRDGSSGNTQRSLPIPTSNSRADESGSGDVASASIYPSTMVGDRHQVPHITPGRLELSTIHSAAQDESGSRDSTGNGTNSQGFLGNYEASSTVGKPYRGSPSLLFGATALSSERGLSVRGASTGNTLAEQESHIDLGAFISDTDTRIIPAAINSTASRPASRHQASAAASSMVHVPSPGALNHEPESPYWPIGESDGISFPGFDLSTDLPYDAMASQPFADFEFTWNGAEGLPYSSILHNQESPMMPRSLTRGLTPATNDFQNQVSTIPRHLFDESDSLRLARLLLENAVSVVTRKELPPGVIQALPTPKELLDTLQSYSLADTAQDGSGQPLNSMGRGDILADRFAGLFLSSIANNFAGLESIPVESIMTFVGRHEPIRSRIFEYLQESHHIPSQALAESIFKVAVEAGDSAGVRFLLQNQLVDPNTVVCLNDENQRLTPVEKAADLQHLEVTKCLVEAGADVNKTYVSVKSTHPQRDRGALEHAIHKWGDYVPVDPNLVDFILNSGAIVRGDLLGSAIRWGEEDVVARLISWLPPAEHIHFLNPRSFILADTIKYLGNDLAFRVVRQVIYACRDMHNGQCMTSYHSRYNDTRPHLGYAMTYAAKKANIELVQLLTAYVDQEALDTGLIGAASSGSNDLVHFLLRKGGRLCASLEGFPMSGSIREVVTTALAEAIRTSNHEIILLFEEKGALDMIVDLEAPRRSDHLEAALHAVAEVGNMFYLQKLFQLIPVPYSFVLSSALHSAIKAENEEITMALIKNGADGQLRSSPSPSPLIEALRVGSKLVVSATLETEVYLSGNEGTKALSAAVKRGDMSLVEDLVSMGVNFKLHQERPYPCIRSYANEPKHGPSPLATAVLAGDSNLVKYLLKHGADSADEDALEAAMKNNGEVFGVLFGEFHKQYPRGILGFGAGVLYYAILTGKDHLISLCLDANLDLNCFIYTEEEHFGLNALGSLISEHRDTRLDLVAKLLDAGADVNAIASRHPHTRGSQGSETVLLLAIETKSVPLVRLLVHRGADVHKAAKLGLKRTPLQKACEVASYGIVLLLLEHHADVNGEPAFKGGGTALQMAAKSGSVRIAKLLLNHGVSVNAPASQVDGHCAIEFAAKYGRLDMIELLCRASDPPLTGTEFRGAIAAAKEYGHRACVQLLQRLSCTGTSQSLINFPV